MRRRAPLRALAGIVLLVAAVGLAALSTGVARAWRAFDDAAARRTVSAPRAVAEPGMLQSAGERLLGIRARAQLQRADARYRAGLADVIPGTTFPQTRARWSAAAAIGRLRPGLDDPRDRAAADTLLGHVLAGSALAAGPGNQRRNMRDDAVAAFVRAVRADPANAGAKHALELLLREASDADAQPRGDAGHQASQKPTATPRAEQEGSGY
jgi:hypothetical protein